MAKLENITADKLRGIADEQQIKVEDSIPFGMKIALDIILMECQNAAMKGDKFYHFMFYGPLHPGIICELEKRGFSYSHILSKKNDNYFIKISWE